MLIRTASILGLAVLLGAAPGDDGVKFTSATLQKGARAMVTTDFESTMSMSMKGLGADSKQEASTIFAFVFTIDVTATEKDAASGAKIKLDRANAHVQAMGIDQQEDMPGAGSSWKATRAGDAWKFEGEDGKAPDEELAKALNDFLSPYVGKPPLATALDGKTLKVGDKVTVDGDTAKKIFTYLGSTTSFQSVELELKSTGKEGDAPVAVFALKAKASEAMGPGGAPGAMPAMSLTLEGEITVSTTSLFVLRGAVKGPLSMDTKVGEGDNAMSMSGSGQVTWKHSAVLK